MAGLCEACTHVAAVLFYLETSAKVNAETCTQQQCQWVIPAYQREIPYLPVKDINFTSAKRKTKTVDGNILSAAGSSNTSEQSSSTQSSSTDSIECSGLNTFFQKLSECGTKPAIAILSIIDPYAERYIPKATLKSFPKPLQSYYDDKYIKYGYLELLAACEEVEIVLTDEMAKLVEQETRDQSKSKLWFTYRAGRITASRMKSACHTNTANPSQSLVKAVAYPEAFKFSSDATSWMNKKLGTTICRQW